MLLVDLVTRTTERSLFYSTNCSVQCKSHGSGFISDMTMSFMERGVILWNFGIDSQIDVNEQRREYKAIIIPTPSYFETNTSQIWASNSLTVNWIQFYFPWVLHKVVLKCNEIAYLEILWKVGSSFVLLLRKKSNLWENSMEEASALEIFKLKCIQFRTFRDLVI